MKNTGMLSSLTIKYPKTYLAVLLITVNSYSFADCKITKNGPGGAISQVTGSGVCLPDVNHVENALNGSQPDPLISVSGNGNSLNFQANEITLINHNGNQSRAVEVNNNGYLHFEGDLNVILDSANPSQNYGIIINESQGSVLIDKNLSFSGNIGNSFIYATHGLFEVLGNTSFNIGRNSSFIAAAIVAGFNSSETDAVFSFNKKTSIINDAGFSSSMILHGVSQVSFDELQIDSSGVSGREVSINGDASLVSKGKTVITGTRPVLFQINGDSQTKSLVSLGETDESINLPLALRNNTLINIGKLAELHNHENNATGIYIDNNSDAITDVIVKGILDINNGLAIESSGNGQEHVKVDGGVVKGNIKLGKGDDSVDFNFGAMSGNVLMGDGSDYLRISEGMDISNLKIANGHEDNNKKNNDDFDRIVFDGPKKFNIYTSLISEIDGSTNLLNWNEITAGNGAELNITSQIFESDNVENHQLNLGAFSKLTMSTSISSVQGSVSNSGVISMSNNFAGDHLTIEKDYTGNSGTLVFDTVLGGDDSLTDKLTVKGDTLGGGGTFVRINQTGGNGAMTQDGIRIIEILGNSGADFILDGRVVAGKYDYFLRKNGLNNQDGNWYLRSELSEEPVKPVDPIVRPEPLIYSNNHWAANSLFLMRLQDRLGETQYIDPQTGKTKVSSIWLRQVGAHGENRDDSGQINSSTNRIVTQLGGDVAQWSQDGYDRYHLGLMAGYAKQNSRSKNSKSHYRADGTIDGYSVGIYGTWFGNAVDKTGAYVDTWVNYSWFDNEVRPQELETTRYKSQGLTASAETGYTFKVGQNSDRSINYFLQPKAQLIWMNVHSDNFTENQGGSSTSISFENKANWQMRLGVRAYLNNTGQDKESGKFEPFVEANWIHNTRNYGVSFNNDYSAINGGKNTGELKLGIESKLSDKFYMWGNVSHQMGTSNYKDSQAMVGIKYTF